MIIFDLDGTLALCEHRRHFVTRPIEYVNLNPTPHPDPERGWLPDWKSFYEACDQDNPNQPIIDILRSIIIASDYTEHIEIWSGRCESVKYKTVKWLEKYVTGYVDSSYLKMRPLGDYTPDEQLKERWLDEYLASGGKPIKMVFDDRQKVVDMWRRNGITCLQVAPGDF